MQQAEIWRGNGSRGLGGYRAVLSLTVLLLACPPGPSSSVSGDSSSPSSGTSSDASSGASSGPSSKASSDSSSETSSDPAASSKFFYGCSAASVGMSKGQKRPRGPDPPFIGTDAIPGVDLHKPRPPAPELEDVTPGGLVLVPAGPFWMGRDEVPDEAPRRQLTLPAFKIERTEVSRGQFLAFIESGGYNDPDNWSVEGWMWRAHVPQPRALPPLNYPMVDVSFYEAGAYAKWAGRRLPTEAEWEKAARGTDGRLFPWGDKADPTRSNHWLYKHTPPIFRPYTWPVASARAGQSPYGLLHMAGNVWEWTQDFYHGSRHMDAGSVEGGVNRPTPWRTIRGGDWTTLLSYQTASHREPARPEERRPTLGFRCVADVGAEGETDIEPDAKTDIEPDAKTGIEPDGKRLGGTIRDAVEGTE